MNPGKLGMPRRRPPAGSGDSSGPDCRSCRREYDLSPGGFFCPRWMRWVRRLGRNLDWWCVPVRAACWWVGEHTEYGPNSRMKPHGGFNTWSVRLSIRLLSKSLDPQTEQTGTLQRLRLLQEVILRIAIACASIELPYCPASTCPSNLTLRRCPAFAMRLA
ncbi:uncharacterized protein BP01DRAFT_96606 [Aspergillus saccharolyticus JOP 1030-1]|uniref:Uncharacterized protein n=1 Tax=Aspergillus saccharolyticus JOP 1030-1 TaxID=1450539 RepID=A0A318ZIY4_9EURO|nr:hypothetical protein BP01DRAFT_96606 [Aspergillus saccharolyticus JOP 1030-1]PYH43670.1 hypothetical protein BP01DRAFT_96606 [Aspergillus saccharolyticus JOP 1030-1]